MSGASFARPSVGVAMIKQEASSERPAGNSGELGAYKKIKLEVLEDAALIDDTKDEAKVKLEPPGIEELYIKEESGQWETPSGLYQSFAQTKCTPEGQEFKCTFNYELKQHLQKHTGEKPFQCELCDYKCSRKIYLKKHTLIHTPEKTFLCEICSSKFTRKEGLQRHTRIHTGKKPFKCDLCDCVPAKFTSRGTF